MNNIKILIAVRSQLITRGILHYLDQLFPAPETEFITIASLLNHKRKKESCLLIIDQELLPDPKTSTIEKIYNNYSYSRIVAVSSTGLPPDLSIYFDMTILINDPEDTLIKKLRTVYPDGDTMSRSGGTSLLSDRETEVLKYVALGHTNKKISVLLSISPHTVISHRKNISSKLGIKTIAGLTVYAVLNGIIPNDKLSFRTHEIL